MTASWPASRSAKASFALFLAIAAAVSYAPRVLHYWEIQREHEQNFGGEVAVASADSYLWFRAAREIRAGQWHARERDVLRNFPDGMVRGDAPWIARAIAFLARWTNGDVYRAGQWFALATSCLFVFPLLLYTASIGWPAAGFVAILIGTSSEVLINRTSVYWVDTDSINLFALFSICLIFSLSAPCRPFRHQLAIAALAGASVALFVEWYSKPGFYVVHAAVFVVCLIGRRFPLRRVVLLTAVFCVFGNPLNLSGSVSHLSRAAGQYVGHAFADDVGEVAPQFGARSDAKPFERVGTGPGEMKRLSYADSLSQVLELPWFAAAGVLCWVSWALYHWRMAAPLLPVAVLGVMGLLVGNRFLMYLAPVVGMGLGVALTWLVRRIAARTRFATQAEAASCVAAFALFGLLLPATHYTKRPPRTVSGTLLESLKQASEQLPPAAAVWYTWGEGYLVQDVMGAATYADGGPAPVVEHLYLQGLTSSVPLELQRTLKYLHAHPKSEVRSAVRANYRAAREAFMSASGEVVGNAFLLFTRQSMAVLSNYFKGGRWEQNSGWSDPEPIIQLSCQPDGPRGLTCLDWKGQALSVDLERGRLDGRAAIERLVYLRNGFAAGERRFPHRPGFVLEILLSPPGRRVSAYLMGPRAFESNLNQIYMLGRWDKRYFELVYDDFPTARMFRVRDPGEAQD